MFRFVALLFLLAVTIALPVELRAEGACPPGFYPIGGQGVQGCAPIPGAAPSNQGPSSNPGPPTPTGRWHDTWGAVAGSSSTSWAGSATDQPSKARAEKVALQKCADEGAKDCSVLMSYYNQCFAWVVPVSKSKGSRSGMGTGQTLDIATAVANKKCIDTTGRACEMFYSDCAKPTFEKF